MNFEELRAKYEKSRPELLVFSSMYHGGHVQSHWAYTCRSWFVGACSGLPCNVLNPIGEVVASSTNYYPYITSTINLDYAVVHLDENWQKLNDLRKKYGVNVIAIRNGQKINVDLDPKAPLTENMNLVIIAHSSKINKLK